MLHCIFSDVHGCSQIDGHILFLDPLMQELFFHKNHWVKVLSILVKIRPELLVVLNFKRIKYFSKPFHACRLRTLEDWKRQTSCYEGNLIAAHHQVTLRQKFFFHCPLSVFFSFFSFLFFGLLRQLSQICRVWLISTLQKVRTRSPYVANIEIVSFGRSLTWFTIAYILNRCLFSAVFLDHQKKNARTE